MPKIIEKTFQNLSRNLPKSIQNLKKSKKIVKKMQDGARCAQKSKKIEQMRKNCEKVAQDPPKRSVLKTSAGRAMPCLESDRTKIGPLRTRSNYAGGGTPAHCDAERISAGVLFRNCVVALLKFFNAVVRLCCSSSQILQSRP